MPTAASSRGPTSETLVQGIDGVGTPWGSAPVTFTPSAARSNQADTTVAPTTATSTAGIFVVILGRTRSTASTERPNTSAVVSVASRFVRNWRTSSTKPSASVEKPNSFGSWPTMIVMPSPFM